MRASTHHLAPARPAARPAALSPASPTARSTANAEETLIIQPGRGLHVSIDAATTMHTHHAFKLVIPLEGGHLSLGQRVNAGVKFGAMPVLVAPDETQWMRVDGACMALFIQPESLGTIPTRWRLNHGPLAQALSGALAQQVSALGARWLRSDHTHDAAAGILADALDLLHRNDILRPSPLDPRIARALTLIDAAPAARWPLSVLAAAAKWSPTWFARRFQEEVGTPLRPYLLWRRLLGAASQFQTGAPPIHSIADVALRAGFSDHAHLTRTARRMLGRAPSDFVMTP